MSCTPTLLLILDGYGLAPEGAGNAVRLAHTPTLDSVLALSGRTELTASGRAVGLPEGYMGNSEVGHLNIGAGRIVYQDMTRIDVAIEQHELEHNAAIQALFASLRASGGCLHLMGLLSDGGVHSHIRHVEALLGLAARAGIPVRVHAFMDGRDTSPTSGAGFVERLLAAMQALRGAYPASVERPMELATACGRFYAMDRDTRWERVEVAWNLLVHGVGTQESDPVACMRAAYETGETDEFLKPRLFGDPDSLCLRDGDGILCFNFRADRMRELVGALHLADFDGFDRGRMPQLAKPCGLVCMTAYESSFDLPVAFVKDNLHQTLGEVVSAQGLAQLRLAETEKYAHVTYFFNGGREEAFAGEDRILVPSPKDVDTYDRKPEMSVEAVTDRLLEAWQSGRHSLVVCNFANPDMVGHTGKIDAAIKALEAVDRCVARVLPAVFASGGRVALTADHGNAEALLTPEGKPQTAHTCNPVPFVVLEAVDCAIPLRSGGKLGDIAPTLLALWGIGQPEAMTGESLLAAPSSGELA